METSLAVQNENKTPQIDEVHKFLVKIWENTETHKTRAMWIKDKVDKDEVMLTHAIHQVNVKKAIRMTFN